MKTNLLDAVNAKRQEIIVNQARMDSLARLLGGKRVRNQYHFLNAGAAARFLKAVAS